jgi:hypothetical protein
MKEGTKQLRKHEEPVPESYLLCTECDGTWVDSKHGRCTDCPLNTTSKDFHLCLGCALREHRCQHCGQRMHIHITSC